MKKIIPCLLIIGFLFSGCSFKEKPKEDIFTKKKECLLLKEQEELMKNRNVLDLFYSSKENTCIIAEEIDSDDESFQLKISDYLTNKTIHEAYFKWDFARCDWSETIENKNENSEGVWTLKYSNKYIFCMNRVTVMLDELKWEQEK